eukprot:4914443-Prymnesium_polylepis.1
MQDVAGEAKRRRLEDEAKADGTPLQRRSGRLPAKSMKPRAQRRRRSQHLSVASTAACAAWCRAPTPNGSGARNVAPTAACARSGRVRWHASHC